MKQYIFILYIVTFCVLTFAVHGQDVEELMPDLEGLINLAPFTKNLKSLQKKIECLRCKTQRTKCLSYTSTVAKPQKLKSYCKYTYRKCKKSCKCKLHCKNTNNPKKCYYKCKHNNL